MKHPLKFHKPTDEEARKALAEYYRTRFGVRPAPVLYKGTPLEYDCTAGTEPRTRYSQDQYRCSKCGLIWDIDEPRPPCQNT